MSLKETISPVYFGSESNLYGCNHLTADFNPSTSLLICQPVGHEYDRAHRAMRQLAIQVARKGIPAMRFDYYATGDSAGNSDELHLPQMRNDIQQAIKYCKDTTNTALLTLVGLRLGATLAAQLAHKCPEIESLVLYAPVFDGGALLKEWELDQYNFYAKHSHMSRPANSAEILGFPITEEFRNELNQKFLPDVSNSSLKRVLILVDDVDSASLEEWVAIFNNKGIDVSVEAVEDIAIWRREPMDAIVPIKIIRRIIKWITEI